MRKVTLFIAMSLDGYIADQNGKVDWLNGPDEADGDADPYPVFIKGIDTVIMGWNTYHQIATELSPEEWVYTGLTSYVITHRDIPSTDGIIFTRQNPCDLVRELRQKDGKGIWICGGANVIQQLTKDGLIDEYDISVIPIILGAGIRLFEENPDKIRLKRLHTKEYYSITELVYKKTAG